ncbi:MAG TPA: nitroreductase family deazaflavin-dependent oxidoreductase [Dehalococcoidia bacterium]|nr:nitroreductase family deazaflavin-dependent oxidoreductase [Dehalococcoidia bacterium]
MEASAFYRRPGLVTRWMNRALAWVASLGLTPSDTVAVETRGRRTGRPRVTPVTWVELEGRRYLVSPRGESEWVRNVRAAGGEAVIRRRGRRPVRLEEVAPDRRAQILQAYLRKTRLATRQHFGVDPEAPLEEFERIAARHPVFLIVET